MAKCVYMKECLFFNSNELKKPVTEEVLKNEFCKNNYFDCARYILMQNAPGIQVPNDLYPNQKERASQIIASS